MPLNPHLNHLCKFCVHHLPAPKGRVICNNDEVFEHYNKLVMEEAKECNLYRTDTNIDEFKEQAKGGWS